MGKTAWVFPGQGSQAVGMGADFLETAIAAERYRQADSVLGWSVADQCQGDLEHLSQTKFTQPCLYVVSAVIADSLRSQGLEPDLVAGHSLGEYPALYAAGVIEFVDGLRLVKLRAELMSQASAGKMMALMGFDRAELEAAVADIDEVVLANDNHAGQVVISGTPEAVDELASRIKVKRAVPLNVSGAFHSHLMKDAAVEFNKVLDLIQFRPAKLPVLANVDPTPAQDPEELRKRLKAQMTGPVRWREIGLAFNELGVERVLEVGPGKVLTGLVKRTCPDAELVNVSTAEAVAGLAP